MNKIASNILELIGNTPMLCLSKYCKNHSAQANIIGKLEEFNPGGSAKDRIALQMINDAEEEGKLQPGATIIEPTSGNTGVGIACVAAVKGYKSIMVMPETMSIERRTLLKAFGAKVELTKANLGMQGSIDKAIELQKAIPNSIILQQFCNPSNIKAHYNTTAEEIWKETEGKIDIFVAGVGTGGTISGIGKKLKEYNSNIKIVAVEPFSSQVLAGKKAGPHKIQGIGANFIPETFLKEFVDEIIPIKDNDAILTARQLPQEEGLLVGISAGAAVYASLILSKRIENKNKNIVVLIPDSGERYLSTLLYAFDEYPL